MFRRDTNLSVVLDGVVVIVLDGLSNEKVGDSNFARAEVLFGISTLLEALQLGYDEYAGRTLSVGR